MFRSTSCLSLLLTVRAVTPATQLLLAMSLCTGMVASKLMQWRKRRDDRPFGKEKKPVLPIRGFKGNRVIYGDISDVEEEDVQTNLLKDVDEPLYNEPDYKSFTSDPPGISYKDGDQLLRGPPGLLGLATLNSPESGYSSNKALSSSQGYTSRETSDDEDEFFHFTPGNLRQQHSG